MGTVSLERWDDVILRHQFDVRIVVGDVSLEDLPNWSHYTLETIAIELDTLERRLGNDGGGTGSVEKKSDLSCKLFIIF